MAEQQQVRSTAFKSIHLFKDQNIGIAGSYGNVCKAECDGLLCAAKIIHETLVDPDIQDLRGPREREHMLQMRRFEQQCKFLSKIRHPNVIQYLGMYKDPKSDLPCLLMEWMDDNLTRFLKSSPQPIPYHIQVNICHDITVALSFLHSNGIIHRILSSNNVLMTFGNNRAKITDFGMASLGILDPHDIFTLYPGSDVYMPPEAVQDQPVLTEKIDCFSFGVIAIQIMTRLLPKPGDRQRKLVGIFEMRISEVERRQNHISKIDRNHPLLPIALDCLKDRFVDRPSAEELRNCVASLKQSHMYRECVRRCKEQKREITRRLESLQQQYAQEIERLQKDIQSKVVQLEEKDLSIKKNDEAIKDGQQEYQKLKKQFQKEKKDEMEKRDAEIWKLKSQLKQVTSEKEIAMIRVSKLESKLKKENQILVQQIETSNNEVQRKDNCMLKRREQKKEISEMAATVKRNFVYIMEGDEIYAYDAITFAWYGFPGAGYSGCALAIVKSLLTLIGGKSYQETTNKLFSCTTERRNHASWIEEFPPMPTSRYGACALCTGAALIVAGGEENTDSGKLATIEVLNTATSQWSKAVDLPQQMIGGSLLQIGSDTLYILGAYDRDQNPIKSVHTCSLNALLQSRNSHSLGENCASLLPHEVWTRMTNIPATDSAYVSFQGQLLAIGGKESNSKPTSAIHTYCACTNSWKVVSHMVTPRRKPYAAILHDNQLLIIGGFIGYPGIQTDTVETVTIV